MYFSDRERPPLLDIFTGIAHCDQDTLWTFLTFLCQCLFAHVFIQVMIINIFYLILQHLIALPVSFVFDEVSFCIMLCIINACLVRPCRFSQWNHNEHVLLLPVVSSMPTWGTQVTRQTHTVR